LIAVNALSQIAAFGSVVVIQAAYMAVIARVLGPGDFGRYSVLWSLVQILLIGGDFGSHNTALRMIARSPRDSEEIVPVFFGVKVLLAAVLGTVFMLAGWAIEPVALSWSVLAGFALGLAFHSLSMGVSVVFQAHERLYVGSLNTVVLFLLQGVLGVIGLLAGGRLPWLGVAYLTGAFLGLSSNLVFLSRRLHPVRLSWAGSLGFLRRSASVGAATLFQATASRLGPVLVAMVSGSFQSGIYSAAVRIPQALVNVPSSIMSAVLPTLASREEATGSFRSVFTRSLTILLLLAFSGALVLSFFAGPIVGFLFGPEYRLSVPVLRILAWSLVPVFVGSAFCHVILSQGRLLSRLLWVMGSALAVSIPLTVYLAVRTSAIGGAWALLVSESMVALGSIAAAYRFLRNRSMGTEESAGGRGKPKIGVVVQRFGTEVIGGAERLAMQVAEGLSGRYDVEVLTTRARDYRHWANEYPEGAVTQGSLLVRRFHVSRPRPWRAFGWLSSALFALNRKRLVPTWLSGIWVSLQGPCVPDLIAFLRTHRNRYDAVIFFTYLYYPTVRGLPLIGRRALLVPTAHREPALDLPCYRQIFSLPGFLMFLTEGERQLVQGQFPVSSIPNDIAGFGVRVHEEAEGPGEDFLLYIGRVETGKGCGELFEIALRSGIDLRVIGPSQMEVPAPIRYLGVLDEVAKNRQLARCKALIVPSVQESLSIVALEAWAFGKPVIAREGSVVADLVAASGGGYCYSDSDDLRAIVASLDPARGGKGRDYVREHYSREGVLRRFEKAVEVVINGPDEFPAAADQNRLS